MNRLEQAGLAATILSVYQIYAAARGGFRFTKIAEIS
jgi:hypothetical protein